jgi:hypothetical protein
LEQKQIEGPQAKTHMFPLKKFSVQNAVQHNKEHERFTPKTGPVAKGRQGPDHAILGNTGR